MGEIDTKPIESVQTVLSFFGQDHKKNSPTKDEQELQEVEREREVERELACIKLQNEAKDNAYKQALIQIDHLQKTAEELSTLLNNSDLRKELYINESREAKHRVNELQSALEHSQAQLTSMEAQLSILREAKSLSRIQEIERELKKERAQKEEFVRQMDSTHVMETRINSLSLDLELQEKMNSDQSAYISLLETEVKQLRIENADVKDVKTELDKAKEQENEAQVEIALLKFEVHKARSRLAAAEAAETRAQAEKAALYSALQQMGAEAEEMNRENRLLKESIKRTDHYNDDDITEQEHEEKQVHDHDDVKNEEVEKVKRELEAAVAKIGELRMRSEQAMSRAEAAEKAKGVLEEKMKRRKEQKERRKAALAALREESISRNENAIVYEDHSSIKNYQPLGKVLNMKF